MESSELDEGIDFANLPYWDVVIIGAGPGGLAASLTTAHRGLTTLVIEAKANGASSIEIWGDGHQTRSFMYVDDCVEGIKRIMDSEILEPINLGSDELITINGLAEMVEEIAGVTLEHEHNLSAPKGVNGRNSDNTKIQQYLGWAPGIRLRDGMEKTFAWIEAEYQKKHAAAAV